MKLNEKQEFIIRSTAQRICVIAGPGSGKTRVLVERIRAMAQAGVDPKTMVAITFTNAAAREIDKRLEGVQLGYSGTLHGYLLRLLQAHGRKVGLAAPLTILDEADRAELVVGIMHELRCRESIKAVNAAIARGPVETQERGWTAPAALVALAYWRRMAAEGLLDCDAILHYGLLLLRELKPSPIHLFADELQDSGDLDTEIYRAMTCASRFMVGDPDQAIYGFRGANVNHIVAEAQRAGTETVLMQANYRSGPAICAAATRLIQHNRNRVDKVVECDGDNLATVEVQEFENASAERLCVAVGILRTPNHNECAVLLRTNKLVTQFKDLLKLHHIPVATITSDTRPSDWKEALRFMSFLANPDNDTLAMWWLVRTVGPTLAGKIQTKAMEAFTTINNCHFKVQPLPPAAFPTALARANFSPAAVELGEATVAELPEHATAVELLYALNREQPQDRLSEPGVTVTTMHGGKGREFDDVWLPAFEQATLPGRARDACLEEERRLAFVALTRARHRLTITWARVRPNAYTDQSEPMAPSQFIAEAGL